MFKAFEKNRITSGPGGTEHGSGNNGAFIFPAVAGRGRLLVIISDGGGWEHVSVSNPLRCPTWEEMCFIKDMFWHPDDCVVQFHPPRSQYINNHEYCLHLWRKSNTNFETPPMIMV
jgi:hypothetical protein